MGAANPPATTSIARAGGSVAIGRGVALGASLGDDGDPVVGAGAVGTEEAPAEASGREELGSGPPHAASNRTMTTIGIKRGGIGIILRRSGRVVPQP
jgi:hypothetical protein